MSILLWVRIDAKPSIGKFPLPDPGGPGLSPRTPGTPPRRSHGGGTPGASRERPGGRAAGNARGRCPRSTARHAPALLPLPPWLSSPLEVRVTPTMDSKDRLDPKVPAVQTRVAGRPALLESALLARPAAQAAEPVRSYNLMRTLLRAVSRHWWQILTLWVIGTGGLCYLIATRVKPSYQAFSMLRVEPPKGEIFNSGRTATRRWSRSSRLKCS